MLVAVDGGLVTALTTGGSTESHDVTVICNAQRVHYALCIESNGIPVELNVQILRVYLVQPCGIYSTHTRMIDKTKRQYHTVHLLTTASASKCQ